MSAMMPVVRRNLSYTGWVVSGASVLLSTACLCFGTSYSFFPVWASLPAALGLGMAAGMAWTLAAAVIHSALVMCARSEQWAGSRLMTLTVNPDGEGSRSPTVSKSSVLTQIWTASRVVTESADMARLRACMLLIFAERTPLASYNSTLI